MKISVLLFAKAKELVGAESVVVEVDDKATVADLSSALLNQHTALRDADLPLLWAVNQEYASLNAPLRANDSVACFPPVSGG